MVAQCNSPKNRTVINMNFLETSAAQSDSFASSKVMTAQFLQALHFAAHKHRDQRRKDLHRTPYINHPIAVANILLNEAGVTDECVLIAALLHDTVEDTKTTFEEIEQHFGQMIRAIVSEVTDDKSLPKAVRKQQQLEHASQLSDRARLVKLADKTANLRDITAATPEGWSVSRLDDYLEWGKAVINNLRGTHPQLEALFDQAYEQGKATISNISQQ
jgi:(p)ppGpp synthase/HD superfamily hydrolase